MIKYLKYSLIAAMTILLASCTRVEPDGDGLGGEALLQIGLSLDEGVVITPTRSSDEGVKPMDPETIPDVDSLYVELYREGKRLYFGKYEEAKARQFRVNAGNWRLLAFHGDSTACGFDKPFFFTQEDFTVDGGLDENGEPNLTTVEAVAKVENVRIAVNFDETVPGSYYDYFVRFSNVDTLESRDPIKYKQILRYKKGETRDAYMMATEQLKIEFMAQLEYGVESSWKVANLGTVAVANNDFLTVNISVKDPRNGILDVDIKRDENIIRKDSEVEILEVWTPQEAPKVVAAGFVDGNHAVVEGDEAGNSAAISVVARGGLANFFLTFNSCNGLDVPIGVPIDLANPSDENAAHIAKLVAAGLEWDNDMLGKRSLTYMKMSAFFKSLNDQNRSIKEEKPLASFVIEVVDEVGKSTTETLVATAYPIKQTLSIPEGRVWSRKIVSPLATITRGLGKLFRLQVSSDGQTWSDVTGFVKLENNILDYGTLAVEPATTYYYRSIYNNNPDLVSNTVSVTTESPLQVGNPGFEEYHDEIMHVSPQGWLYDYDRTWYLPYNAGDANPWWAVNSKKTMPDGHTAWTSNWCKNFPCTAYSTDAHSGTKSAMVYTVNVGNTNTDGTAVGSNTPGEIWIGRANDSGDHTQDGRPFASRPASLKFWYKYAPHQSETFVVNVVLKDAGGNVIANVTESGLGKQSRWTQYELPIVYDVEDARAATLYISFKSAASGKVQVAKTVEIAGSDQKAHIGSVLRIDDIELTY